MALGGVWIPVTLLASSAQTLRNAMQRDLIGALGAVGAVQVRFPFRVPFAVMFLAGLMAATRLHLPRLTTINLAWTAFGAVSQVIATGLMLSSTFSTAPGRAPSSRPGARRCSPVSWARSLGSFGSSPLR
jgi:hypothetical protein